MFAAAELVVVAAELVGHHAKQKEHGSTLLSQA
jgi:hypothetical protein